MLEEVLFATFSMIVICTSLPAAAAAPRVYEPLKSLAGAAKALNASASKITAEIRRDVRAEIMGFLQQLQLVAEAGQKMKALLKLLEGWEPGRDFALIPILRVVILVKRYLISKALIAAWRRIKFSKSF